MHEVGHTLGLKHAGEGGRTYADKTGYMGSTYKWEAKPLMCFNGAHHHQLGWFAKKEVYVSPQKGEWAGNLVAFVDAALAQEKEAVLITIEDITIQYNRVKDFNSGPIMGKDMITITEGSTSSTSWLKNMLIEGDDHETYGLTIRFCKEDQNSKGADVAKVSISPTVGGRNFCLDIKKDKDVGGNNDDWYGGNNDDGGDDDWGDDDDDRPNADDDNYSADQRL